MVKLYGWVMAFGILGCGSTAVTATGPEQEPRERTCEFEILTSTPLIGYKEIGTIDVTPGAYGVDVFTDLSRFKRHIREQVCRLGGDAAIASANGYGMYIKASIMKRIAPEAPTQPIAAAVAAQGMPMGCAFDSQCKGDRICVEGKCQDPPAKAASQVEAPPLRPLATAPSAAAPKPGVAPPAPPKATPPHWP
jgi:hypothetical protein